MISLINIEKKFDDVVVLNKVNLQVKQGDYICITGISGSGKSTLLNIIGTLEKSDAGVLEINNEVVRGKTARIRRKYFSFIFQNFGLLENESVYTNLTLTKGIFKQDKQYDKSNLRRVLKQVELDVDLQKLVYKLSGGQQQRLAIAKALLKSAPIIVADEPTGNLDAENTKILLKLFKQLNEAGTTIIIVSHDRDVIEQIPSRYRLDNGVLVEDK